MSAEKFEPKLLTFVAEAEISAQFKDFGELDVTDARLISEVVDTVTFRVQLRLEESTSLGQIGALLLWMNEFGFQHLGNIAEQFRVIPYRALTLNCEDVVNYYPVRTAAEFSQMVESRSTEREFFMQDEDHRYMSQQLAESWRQPDRVQVHIEVVGLIGGYGTFEKKSDLHYQEWLSGWKATSPNNVLLEDYEKRLRSQSPLNS